MSKIKKIISILASAVLCFATFAFVACGGGDDSSTPASPNTESSDTGSNEELDCYVFNIVNAEGVVYVQLCEYAADGVTLGTCYMPVQADENGKVEYTAMGFPGAGVYEIHLLDESYQAIAFEETNKKTPATYSEITLTIAD